ncbi:MAG: alpha/beta hydrolase family protein [Candidatus Limnocylindrales bacterium]
MTPRVRLAAGAAVALAVVVLVAAAVLVGTAPHPSPVPPSPLPSATPAAVSPLPSPVVPLLPSASAPTATPAPPVVPGPPASCGPFDPACSRLPISGQGQLAFTSQLSCGTLGPCTLDLDVYYPRLASATPGATGSGPGRTGPWPVIVAVPGGPAAPGIRHGLGDFASLLAGQGAVVFVADYREGAQYGGTFPLPYEDIGCAIRYARANAAQYGGNGSKVTLVAHSLGGFFASTEALSPDPFTPAPGACLTTSGSTKPDAFIGIAGIYSQQEITPGFLNTFFGTVGGVADGGSAGATSALPGSGTPGVPSVQASAPADWAAGNPFALVRAHGNPGLVVRLIQGADDTNVRPAEAQSFEQALQAAGYNAVLTMVPSADHNSVLQNALTIRTVMETALGLGQ